MDKAMSEKLRLCKTSHHYIPYLVYPDQEKCTIFLQTVVNNLGVASSYSTLKKQGRTAQN